MPDNTMPSNSPSTVPTNNATGNVAPVNNAPVNSAPVSPVPVDGATTTPKKSNKILFIVIALFVFICLVLGAVAAYFAYKSTKDDKSDDDNDTTETQITNFEECEEAGYPIMESYPRQCAVPGGDTYTEDIDIDDTATNDTDNTSDDSATGEDTDDSDASTTKNIKIYFPRDPDSMDDYDAVFAVNRSSTRVDIGTYAIEQLIAGPTAAEQATGLFDVLDVEGVSNCSNKDFSLNVNKTRK
ncbi:MAG: hypothetical protein US52_C0009G0007 [candidate division WS6 bacterium GW2011_GWA2_37_6]|uniref:Uncharacterized protein n=1 Tax=candidate division WS6 bacterium GW2011_GWA2_37_6 TaxID=1619087 RepID=A0A0G0HC15_9BACT|nr:MAG: hypothetical protein US52_C0009G0007 [candidate division WS6 bacterium GW2011_GWA2_37_6]